MRNIPPNVTQAKLNVVWVIIWLKKLLDSVSVDDHLRSLVPKSEQMHIIVNDAMGGQHLIIRNLQNPALAIRVISAMCHPSVRSAVNTYLEKKTTNREQHNQSYDPILALFEAVLEIFKSSELEIAQPDIMDDIDFSINPVNCNYDYDEYNASWLLMTWVKHLQPKYRNALGYWFKQTGRGGQELRDFPNYCTYRGSKYPWLVWVYFIDMQCGFLLASRTAGKVPSFICREAGYENVAPNKTLMRPKKLKEQVLDSMKSRANRIDKLLDIVEKGFAAKGKEHVANRASNCFDECLNLFETTDNHKKLLMADVDLSPSKQDAEVEAMKDQKRELVDEIIELRNAKKNRFDNN